jgi:anti-sigma regulatory factor (Ser/Thr protein kinase)
MESHRGPPDLSLAVLAETTHLQIPSQLEWIEPTLNYLRDKAVQCGVCDEEQAGRIVLALHEALTNSVVHGNLEVSSALKEAGDDSFASMVVAREADPRYGQRRVAVDVAYDGDRCQWVLTDEGRGFDFESAISRAESDAPDVLLASGRGITMMRAFLDEVRYEEQGRRCVMVWTQTRHKNFRKHMRRPMQQMVEVVPVNADGSVDWEGTREVLAQNLSEGGFAFLQQHLAQVERVVLGLEIDGKPVYVPAQVRHCTPLQEGMVEIGCQFLFSGDVGMRSPTQESHDRMRRGVQHFLNQLQGRSEIDDDRREHPRIAYTEKITLRPADAAGEPITGFGQNISLGGLRLLTTQPVPLEPHVITLTQPDGTSLNLIARILRCARITENCYEVGARFEGLRE